MEGLTARSVIRHLLKMAASASCAPSAAIVRLGSITEPRVATVVRGSSAVASVKTTCIAAGSLASAS